MGTLDDMDPTARRQRRRRAAATPRRALGLALVPLILGVLVVVVPYGSDPVARPAPAVQRLRSQVDATKRALAEHVEKTGIEDPAAEAAAAESRLRDLQRRRDVAVATGDSLGPLLERQVAAAQQTAFDLDAVATRRAELVAAQRRAADAVPPAGAEPTVRSSGTEPWPLWRVGLAAVLFVAGAVLLLRAATIATVRSRGSGEGRRPRRPRRPGPAQSSEPVGSPPMVPEHAFAVDHHLDPDRIVCSGADTPVGVDVEIDLNDDADDDVDVDAPVPTMSLDEIERRLAELTVPSPSETDG
jgi:hypothetical protein